MVYRAFMLRFLVRKTSWLILGIGYSFNIFRLPLFLKAGVYEGEIYTEAPSH
jgi:hypothetical protein